MHCSVTVLGTVAVAAALPAHQHTIHTQATGRHGVYGQQEPSTTTGTCGSVYKSPVAPSRLAAVAMNTTTEMGAVYAGVMTGVIGTASTFNINVTLASSTTVTGATDNAVMEQATYGIYTEEPDHQHGHAVHSTWGYQAKRNQVLTSAAAEGKKDGKKAATCGAVIAVAAMVILL